MLSTLEFFDLATRESQRGERMLPRANLKTVKSVKRMGFRGVSWRELLSDLEQPAIARLKLRVRRSVQTVHYLSIERLEAKTRGP